MNDDSPVNRCPFCGWPADEDGYCSNPNTFLPVYIGPGSGYHPDDAADADDGDEG